MKQNVSYWLDAVLALVFGVLAAGAVWIFEESLQLGERLIPSLPGFFVALLPAIGGLIVGLVSFATGVEAAGGVVDVIAGANLKRRILSIPKNLIKPFLSSVSIATGNPVGSEAPTILIGAQMAALSSYYLNLPRRRKRILIACGAAAGFSAAFGAPLAAVTFVIEIIISEFTTYGFVLIAAASGSAYLFARVIGLGSPFAALKTPGFSWYDIGIGAIIGVACVAVAFLWARLLGFIENRSHHVKYAKLWGPVVGGLVAGLIILFYPEIAGPGYRVIQKLATSPVVWYVALIFLFGKMVGTSAVLGLGGAGGDFAPAMFMGASVGSLASGLLGGSSVVAVIAGVCAQLGATMHAPLTAILLSVEILGTNVSVLPVTMAVVVSLLLSLKIIPRSIYHQKAHEKGIILQKTQFQESAETAISEVMTSPVITAKKDARIKEVIEMLRNNNISGVPVMDGDKIYGVITLSDLRKKVRGTDLEEPVWKFCQTEVVTASPQTTLTQAWEMMCVNEIGRLPIVSASGKLLGIVTKRDMLELAARKSSFLSE
jgi:CIC family chloride channel protein